MSFWFVRKQNVKSDWCIERKREKDHSLESRRGDDASALNCNLLQNALVQNGGSVDDPHISGMFCELQWCHGESIVNSLIIQRMVRVLVRFFQDVEAVVVDAVV